MTPFRHPLPPDALRLFCHPSPGHDLAQPVHTADGTVLAGNGYVALKANAGHWHATDYPAASPGQLHRFSSLPWPKLAAAAADPRLRHRWLFLDDIRADVFRPAHLRMIAPAGVIFTSPIVAIAGQPILLSILQSIARLPGAEFFADQDVTAPLYFRGTQWTAIVPARSGGASFPVSREYFRPPADPITGERIARDRHPRPNFGLTGWPPAIDPDRELLTD